MKFKKYDWHVMKQEDSQKNLNSSLLSRIENKSYNLSNKKVSHPEAIEIQRNSAKAWTALNALTCSVWLL